ncbi:hypothetical protein BACCOPRO_03352 [Phocaeicola coprophilus DSM 18228 = JCM 13818]|uniref:Uncharacterized protein n=1 Tax=Phocaeicola coprophilus DSM 18228 = JCM 13818 TaxID=547042 RepID=S0FC03_9BACT|nr:hypothetical protein BACCOPRO_03352 [Phocaeicola coprophilus DSM 18228 = JCM 13818]
MEQKIPLGETLFTDRILSPHRIENFSPFCFLFLKKDGTRSLLPMPSDQLI